jgi:hypothetical protein
MSRWMSDFWKCCTLCKSGARKSGACKSGACKFSARCVIAEVFDGASSAMGEVAD